LRQYESKVSEQYHNYSESSMRITYIAHSVTQWAAACHL
jgi:hypothetical protein